MTRGFFQRLQQGIERRIGEHVYFIYDVELVSGLAGCEGNPLPQVPDVVYPSVGCCVYLNQIN